ncbi:MAG: PAS domain S-box protein, partial [Methanobacteriota archaeon]
LTNDETTRLAEIVHHTVTFTPIEQSQVPSEAWAADPNRVIIVPRDDATVAGYQLIRNIDTTPGYVLGIELPRDLFHQGQRSLFYILLSIFGTGLLFGIVTVGVLERDVLMRLSTLTRAVDVIGSRKNPAARVDVDRANDEISALATSINSMMTGLQEAHHQLVESERRYHHLVTNLPVGLCRIALDPGGKFIMVNPALARMFGFADAFELVRHRVIDLYDDPAGRDAFVQHLLGKGSVAHYEIRLRRVDGTPFWGRVSAQLVRDAEGTVVYYDAVIEDVTEKKWAEEALRIASMQWHQFLEVSPDPMWITDLSGKYLAVNIAFLAEADLPIEAVIGKSPAEVFKDPNTNFTNPDDPAIPADGCCEAEVTIVSNDEIRTFLVKKVAIRSAGGALTGTLGIARDITDQIRTERSLMQANQKLNILSSVTRHDVLNQLTAIRGYIDLVREIMTDSIERTYLETAASICVKMQSLIAFTKDYQNMGVHKPVWQQVQSLILRAAEMLPRNTIQLDIETGTLELYSDALLEKVFYNLMENAIRHGERVTRITVSYRMERDGLTLLVEDDGVGVAACEKQMIFEQGFGKNTGYGLFLIHEILAITDMTIAETGEPGIGARFEIHVPKHRYRFGAGESA